MLHDKDRRLLLSILLHALNSFSRAAQSRRETCTYLRSYTLSEQLWLTTFRETTLKGNLHLRCLSIHKSPECSLLSFCCGPNDRAFIVRLLFERHKKSTYTPGERTRLLFVPTLSSRKGS